MDKIDDYFYSVLHDGEPILDFSHPDEMQPPARDHEGLLARLIETALEIVIAGSVVNLSTTEGQSLLAWVPHVLDGSSNDQPRFDGLAKRRIGEAGGLQDLNVRLKLAKSLTATLQQHSAHGQLPVGALWEVTADAWQRAGAVCLDLLEHAIANCPESPLSRTAQGVVLQLHAVCDGESPCINAQFQLEIPGFAERRSAPREAVANEIFLFVREQRFKVQLINQSRTGYGLEYVPEVPIGERVILMLPDTSSVSAVVRWWCDGRAGIEIVEQELS